MSTEISSEENKKPKIQFILDENGSLQEIEKDKCMPVEYPIKYKLKNAFEVFVRVNGAENYWISNYGRCVNNLNRKDKNTFYEHKQGKCHYTIFEVERCEVPIKYKRKLTGKTKIVEKRNRRETSPEGLVAETFLVQYKGRIRVWHKDNDESNNWYKNLLTVTERDYKELKAGRVTWQELNLEQEYIEYENKASSCAYSVYYGILARCKATEATDAIHKCYMDTSMFEGWLNDPRSFVKWYLGHYYECGDESMQVDKDLFGDGSNMYHPDFCCILPQGLNAFLANCKKHYFEGGTPDNALPFGVVYDTKRKKYHSKIQFSGSGEAISLSEWDTAEEAFAEYKMMKQADILVMAAKYRDKVPEYIYKKLLTVDVKPY